MKHGFTSAVLLVIAILLIGGKTGFGQIENEVSESSPHILRAQKTAQQFVRRIQQTRDVSALFDELFLPEFISHFSSQSEVASPAVYSRLTNTERKRLFAAVYNFAYLSAIAIIGDYDDMDIVFGERSSNPKLLLPNSIILELKRALPPTNAFPIRSYRRMRDYLIKIERALDKAQVHLRSSHFEQTPEFQSKLVVGDKLGYGINYRVRTYVGGRNIKDCGPLTGFSKNRRFFRVELPLLVGMILVKDGRRMKIVRLTFVDGD
jgi:hypothetical protein